MDTHAASAPRPWARWALPVVAAVFLALGIAVAWMRIAPSNVDAAASARLFEQTYPDADGAPLALATLKGRALVVNFWATWCAPCTEEMPELSEMTPALERAGVQVVGIGIDSEANVRQFASTRRFAYPLLVAGTGGLELLRQFGDRAGGLPYTVVIDADGRVRATMLGRFDRARLQQAALDSARR